jgi:hypothetical protein
LLLLRSAENSLNVVLSRMSISDDRENAACSKTWATIRKQVSIVVENLLVLTSHF